MLRPHRAPRLAATVQTAPAAPAVSITKFATVSPASDQGAAEVGDTIAYSYVVTNTGNVDLASVAVDDPSIGDVTCPTPAPPGLAPGGSETCTAHSTYRVTQSDVDAGNVTDTATANGTDTDGITSAPSSVATATVLTAAPSPSVSLAKIGLASGGDGKPLFAGKRSPTPTWSPIRATSTWRRGRSMTPARDWSLAPRQPPGPGARSLGNVRSHSTMPVTQADVDRGRSPTLPPPPGLIAGPYEPAECPVDFRRLGNTGPRSSPKQGRQVAPAADQGAVQVGDTIAYSYKVTNVGNVTLASVAVADPALGTVTCPTPAAPGLVPGSSETCSADSTYTVTQADVDAGSVVDTATATGTDTQGDTSPPSDPSTVTVPADAPAPAVSLTKTGTVTPSIDQDAAKVGDTIAYSYKVTNVGNVTLASVAADDPALGTVTCPTPAAPGLVPGSSETCSADSTYTVTQADVDAGRVVDTATATGTDTQGGTSPPSDPSTATIHTVTPAPGGQHRQGGLGDPRCRPARSPVGRHHCLQLQGHKRWQCHPRFRCGQRPHCRRCQLPSPGRPRSGTRRLGNMHGRQRLSSDPGRHGQGKRGRHGHGYRHGHPGPHRPGQRTVNSHGPHGRVCPLGEPGQGR